MTYSLIFSCVRTTLSAISSQSYASARVSGLVFSICLSAAFLSRGVGWGETTVTGSRNRLETFGSLRTHKRRMRQTNALLSLLRITLINVCYSEVVVQHSIACLGLDAHRFLFFHLICLFVL